MYYPNIFNHFCFNCVYYSFQYYHRNQTRPSDASRDEVDKGTKEGKRTSRLRSAVHKAKEKLKRDSSRSSCSSDDSENISTSWEEDDFRESKDHLTWSKETSNKG